MSDIRHAIQRMNRALELQDNTEGDIVSTPEVTYCFECDEITVDELPAEKCLDHPTVMSDGYEHGGIQAAITALEQFENAADPAGERPE